jgi:hypothetical protein
MLSKPSNTTIMNAHNLDYMATYENLRANKSIGSLAASEKGLIMCKVRKPRASVQISNKGKINVYYSSHKDRKEVVELLQELIVCDKISIEFDIPRKLAAVQEGIEVNLADLIESEFPDDLNPYKYISPTNPPKTYEALTKRLFECFQDLQEKNGQNVANQKIMYSMWWIVSFVTEVSESNYEEECDRLTSELTSALQGNPYDFRICEKGRIGEGLSLRYVLKWCPIDGPLNGPHYPDNWELAELELFSEIYPDSDPSDIYDSMYDF